MSGPTEGPSGAGRELSGLMAGAARELSTVDLNDCVTATIGLALRHLADRAAVVLPDDDGGFTVFRSAPDGDVVRDACDADPVKDPRGVLDLLPGRRGHSAVVPLAGPGSPAGALVLVRDLAGRGFDPDELGLAELFAARAGAAMAAARHCFEQASITNVLIRELLPPAMRSPSGLELAARYLPSADGDRVGGDFYDLFPGEAETLLVLGDVCGKGLRAAVLAGKIRAVLRAIGPSTGDHLEVLDRLNDLLLPEDDSCGFVTLVLVSAAALDGGLLRLRLTGAGHPHPLVVRRDGRVDRVPTSGTLIGVLPEISAETVVVELAHGDVCLLHTDGVVEARGGPDGEEFLGDDRLVAELARCAGLSPDALADRVQALASTWVGDGARDDMALIAISPGPSR